MALLLIDGFDHYTGSSGTAFSSKNRGMYTIVGDLNTTLTTMPVLGGLGFQVNGGGTLSGPLLRWQLPADKSSGRLGVGFHMYASSAFDWNSTVGPIYICSLASSAGNSSQGWGVNPNTDDFAITPNLYFGTTTTPNTTGNQAFAEGVLYHCEIEFVWGAAGTGSAELRVDGITVFTSSFTFTSTIRYIEFFRRVSSAGGTFTASGLFIDNLYVWDETGSENNDFLGERNVYTLWPDADTAEADWTLSTGSDGYDLIDDATEDTTNRYIESSTVGDLSEFTVDALPSTDIVILGVAVSAQGLKTGTDDTQVNIGIETNGVESKSAKQLIQDQTQLFQHIVTNNPDTGLPWDPNEVNDIELLLERAV